MFIFNSSNQKIFKYIYKFLKINSLFQSKLYNILDFTLLEYLSYTLIMIIQ